LDWLGFWALDSCLGKWEDCFGVKSFKFGGGLIIRRGGAAVWSGDHRADVVHVERRRRRENREMRERESV
jgi:hypothetical protein